MLCSRTVLMALCVTCAFAPASSVAAKPAPVPHGLAAGIHGRLAYAPPFFFRDLLRTLDRPCRYSLSSAFCAENATLAPPAVNDSFSTILLHSVSTCAKKSLKPPAGTFAAASSCLAEPLKTFYWVTAVFSSRGNRISYTALVTGPAAEEPPPPCSSMVTTTIL